MTQLGSLTNEPNVSSARRLDKVVNVGKTSKNVFICEIFLDVDVLFLPFKQQFVIFGDFFTLLVKPVDFWTNYAN